MNTSPNSPTRMFRSLLRIGLLIFSTAILTIPAAQAQLPSKEESSVNSPETGLSLKDIKMSKFTAKALEGVVYLNWYMKGEADNSIFLVERSVNGGEFVSIGFKDGYSAPDANTELLYSFSDNQPVVGTSTYRIKQFRKEGILYGEQLSVIIDEPLPLVQSVE